MLRSIGEEGWVFLTQDGKTRYRAPEREEYLGASLRVFVVSSGNLSAEETAQVILRARRRIENVIETVPGPFIFSVHKNGSLRRLD